MMTHDPVHDTTGPMTKTVELNARVLQAIAGRDGIDDRQFAAPLPEALPNYSASLKAGVTGLKIGILKEAFCFEEILDTRVREKILEAADRFRLLGAEVVEISVPLHSIAGHIVNCALRPAAAQQAYLGRACGRRSLYLPELAEKLSPMDQYKFDRVSCLSLLASPVRLIIPRCLRHQSSHFSLDNTFGHDIPAYTARR